MITPYVTEANIYDFSKRPLNTIYTAPPVTKKTEWMITRSMMSHAETATTKKSEEPGETIKRVK